MVVVLMVFGERNGITVGLCGQVLQLGHHRSAWAGWAEALSVLYDSVTITAQTSI